ncbi:MAG: helix-turn-helix transcriptional regulator [Bacteroidota bacterium]
MTNDILIANFKPTKRFSKVSTAIENLLFSFLFGAAAFQGIILAGLLWGRKMEPILPNRLLAVLNLIIALLLLNNCYFLLDIYEVYPYFLYWPSALWLLTPPVYYLYARSRLHPNSGLKWWDLFHLVPFLVLIFLWKEVLFTSTWEKLDLLKDANSIANQSILRYFIQVVLPIQGLIYLGVSLWLLRRFRQNNQKLLTDMARRQLYHFQLLYAVLLGYIMGMEFLYLIPGINGLIPSWLGWTIHLVLVAVIYGITYLALFDSDSLLKSIQLAKPLFKSRQLPEDQARQYAMKLEEIMQSAKPYLQQELSPEDLAKLLGLQPRQLSRLLKQQFDCTFPAYINTYRLERVKQLLNDRKYDHWSMLAIAMEAGFKSKSTFNRIFKQKMGVTPSQFSQQRRQIIND